MRKLNHSFAIITIFLVFCVTALFVTAVVRRAKADPLPIRFSQSQQTRMTQIQIDEMSATQAYNQAIADVRKRYVSVRDEARCPADWINHVDGNVITGCDPKPDQKESAK